MSGRVVLWRRLDGPGHDACALEPTPGGWTVDGTAVFREEGTVARLTYRVACDEEWRTRDAEIDGWLDRHRVGYSVRRTAASAWTLNGSDAGSDLAGCVDLDLGFTPATNTLQVCRVRLRVGQSADVPVAWLDVRAGTLRRLEQRYERRSESTYWYESPEFGYRALLEVDAAGIVRRYPGLWETDT